MENTGKSIVGAINYLHTAAFHVLVALPAGTGFFAIQNIITARIQFIAAALSYHKWREPKKWKL